MTELSPAAKAVLDAANHESSYTLSLIGPVDCLNESRWIAAAALRAAVAATQMPLYEDCSIKARGSFYEADDLLAFADELEAH